VNKAVQIKRSKWLHNLTGAGIKTNRVKTIDEPIPENAIWRSVQGCPLVNDCDQGVRWGLHDVIYHLKYIHYRRTLEFLAW
jgi:hypothetical protein